MTLAKLAYDAWRLGMVMAGADDIPTFDGIEDSETVPWFAVAEEYEMAMAEREQQSDAASFEFKLSRPLPGLKNLPGRSKGKGKAKWPEPPTRFKVRRPTAADLFDSFEHDLERGERLLFECMTPIDGSLWSWDKFVELEITDLGRLQMQVGATWPTLEQRIYNRWRRTIAEIEACDIADEIHPADADAWLVLERARIEPRESVIERLQKRAAVEPDEDCQKLDEGDRPKWPEVDTWAASNDAIRGVWQVVTSSLAAHDGSFHPLSPGAAVLTPKHPTRMKDAFEGRKAARMGMDVQIVAIGLSRCGIALSSIGSWLAEDAERLMHAAVRWLNGGDQGNAEGETTPSASSSALES